MRTARPDRRRLSVAAVSVVLLLTLSSPAIPAIHAPAAADPPEVKAVDAPELLDVVRRSEADAVLVNVWATWCIPCWEEFPDLLRLRRTYHDRGLELILVSGDFPSEIDQVEAFLAEHGVDFETYIKTGDDMEFIDTLEPDWSGALPATLVYDRRGEKRRFWQGRATYEELERAVLPILESGPADESVDPEPFPAAPPRPDSPTILVRPPVFPPMTPHRELPIR